jgi:pyroglutamyl-peptidase
MRTLLLTGFEPFLDVQLNPSGELARALDGARLRGGAGGDLEVRGRVLPVAFERAPRELEVALDELGEGVAAVVSLGVHRGSAFRLEERARSVFQSSQPDNDGQLGAAVELDGPPERRTTLDLERCERWLREAGAAEVSRSSDAGGYLCERIYRAGLDAAQELHVPALFLHIPPVDRLAVSEQERVVRGFLEALAPHLGD